MPFEGLERLEREIRAAAEANEGELNFTYRPGDDRHEVEEALRTVEESLGLLRMPKVNLVQGDIRLPNRDIVLAEHGLISREGDVTVVRMMSKDDLSGIEGVTCENPEAEPGKRIYRKEFLKKEIFLPDELEVARKQVLYDKDAVCIGMTGYSKIGDKWGVNDETYVAACADVLGSAINEIRHEFPSAQVKIVEGASDMGVDKGALMVAEQLNLRHLGFSCPKFMFYVKDDDNPVYVAATQADYGQAFVCSLDLLLSVGGRMQALEHDMLAAIRHNKRLILLNLLKAISPTGGPPARDGRGNIEDATAAFQDAVLQIAPAAVGLDPYEAVRQSAVEAAKKVARTVLRPASAYSSWQRDA